MINRLSTLLISRFLLSAFHFVVSSTDEVQHLGVGDLKDELRARNLKVSGKKADLISRLLAAFHMPTTVDKDDDDDDDDDDDPPPGDADYGDWHKKPPTSQYSEESGLAALNDYRPPPKGSPEFSSSEARYYGNLNLYAHRYIEEKNLDAGEAMTWAAKAAGAEDGEVQFQPSKIIDILKFIEDDPKATPGVYEMTLRAIPWWLKKQAVILNNAPVPKGFVGSLAGVSDMTARVKEKKGKTMRKNMVDLQGDRDETLSRPQWIPIFTFLMGFSSAAGFDHTPFMFASCLVCVALASALACRGEDIRAFSIGCIQVKSQTFLSFVSSTHIIAPPILLF